MELREHPSFENHTQVLFWHEVFGSYISPHLSVLVSLCSHIENDTCSSDCFEGNARVQIILISHFRLSYFWYFELFFFCSVTGKKLMAKCRMLIQENQELGSKLSQGRVAQLEAELALQKKYSDELKGSQDGECENELIIHHYSQISLYCGVV